MKNFKKLISLILCILLAIACVGCNEPAGGGNGGGGSTGGGDTGGTGGGDTPPSYTQTYDKTINGDTATYIASGKGLKYNGMSVKFVKNVNDGTYGVRIVRLRDGQMMYYSHKPAIINTRSAGQLLVGGYDMMEASAGYSSVEQTDYGFLAVATVTTEKGSKFEVGDCYYMDNGSFAIDRTVTVIKARKADSGFESVFRFVNVDDKEYDLANPNFDVLLPSIMYKDLEYATGGTIGASLSSDKLLVKETRMGMPMSYIRDHKTNAAIALYHLEPQINVHGIAGGGGDGDVDNRLEYASMGFTLKDGMGVELVYPCAEGPTTYDNGSAWTRRFHSVELNNKHTYKVGLFTEENSSYQDSIVRAYKSAYNANDTAVVQDVVIDKIYDHNLYLFSDIYKETNGVPGVPWSIDLETGDIKGGYSLQMGFVGQQTSVGYHLLREGYKLRNQGKDDYGQIEKGKAILNYWSSSAICGDVLPWVWSVPDGEGLRDYPSFLRCFVDGMEGLLDGYLIAQANKEEMTQWRNAVEKVGRFLRDNQNYDGSYYRAYERNGAVSTRTDPAATHGDSRTNTPIAIRFLGRLYELTGDSAYLTCLTRAADYCYDTLYKDIGKYIGGTPDNPDVIDKEAAVHAMYAFTSAYQLTGKEKYLNAAEHAAISSMTWIYAYDFAVPALSPMYDAVNCFANGGACGFSIISTYAKSSADNFSAYIYYDLFKLYVLTGDTFYRDCALLIQNNTKSATNYRGDLNYGGASKNYQALGPEATKIADFDFAGVGTWLPWSGVANVEPIGKMRLAFGNADVAQITADLTTLRAQLDAFGVGGKAVQKEV